MHALVFSALLVASAAPAPTTYVAPVINENGVLFIQASVNGTGPLLFVFDPGAGDFITGYARRRLQGKRVNDVHIGGLDMRVLLPVFDGDARELVAHHNPRLGEIAGSLGPSLLARYAVGLDYKRKIITFTPFSRFRAPSGAIALKFAFDRYRLPVVDASVDDLAGRFEIDVRAPYGMLFTPFVRRGDFARRYSASTPVRRSGTRLEYRVSQLTVGAYHLHDIPTWFSTDTGGKFATSEVAGLLGNDALSKFNVTLNYHTSTVYFATIKAQCPKHWRIRLVPHTPRPPRDRLSHRINPPHPPSM